MFNSCCRRYSLNIYVVFGLKECLVKNWADAFFYSRHKIRIALSGLGHSKLAYMRESTFSCKYLHIFIFESEFKGMSETFKMWLPVDGIGSFSSLTNKIYAPIGIAKPTFLLSLCLKLSSRNIMMEIEHCVQILGCNVFFHICQACENCCQKKCNRLKRQINRFLH